MANRARGEVGVVIGDRAYTLRPTFDAICDLEDAVGKGIDEILEGIKGGRLSGIRAVIFGLLRDAHPNEIRTLKDASQWIERLGEAKGMAPAEAAQDLIIEVFNANSDHEDGAAPVNPPTAQAGTGTPSARVPGAAA